MTIPIAHDFICPWCWIGLFQAERLKKDFGANIDWVAYELFPDELEWPDYPPAPEGDPRKPKTPSRLDLAYAAEQMEAPTAERPKKMRTHFAHEAVEYAKSEGVADQMVKKLYEALWEEGQNINDPAVIAELAKGTIKDIPDLIKAMEERRFASAIIGFDDPAYESGVFNVPTFTIGGVKYAEEPYVALKKAAEAAKR
jgi:predicted DsbA family dithiol-disulfide isomerase